MGVNIQFWLVYVRRVRDVKETREYVGVLNDVGFELCITRSRMRRYTLDHTHVTYNFGLFTCAE